MASPLALAVATLLEAEQSGDDRRFVDLAISLRLCDVERDAEGRQRWITSTDEVLLDAGGRWDRRRKAWAGPPQKVAIIRVHRGQEAAARWFAEWFRRAAIGPRGAHWDDFNRVWSTLLLGGRRGGKSHLALITLAVFGVLVPGARVWAISPTQEETDELEQGLRAMLPRRWYTFRGGGAGKPLQFKLAHGARILCLSGHKPRSLKRGRVDFALYNEAQNMFRAGWIQLRGAIADTGGLVVLAANPPDAEIGRWIETVHEQARAGKNKVALFTLTAKDNPFVEFQALADMEADLNDEVTFRREVLGEFMPIGDIVMHAWSDAESVKDPPPEFVDITAEVTRRVLGRPAGYVVGMDFQRTPHMAAAVFKFFRDPSEPEEVVAWVVDEVVVEDADENDLVDALEALPRWRHGEARVEGDNYRGWVDPGDDKAAPAHCAVVADASGWWQDGAHTRGRTSDRVLASRRWGFLYKPQAESDKNPDIVERCKVSNARLKSAAGRRRAFAARHCDRVHVAMRSWENRGGAPYRRSPYAHVCDSVTYVLYRFFGRPKVKRAEQRYESVRRFSRKEAFRGV